jgi:hypothetical protein
MASTIPRQDQALTREGQHIERQWFLYFSGLQANAGMAIPFRSLPANPQTGQLAAISDSTTAAWGGVIAGGGANTVLAWFNGTNWTVVGA